MTSLWKILVQNRLHKVPTKYRFQPAHLLPEFKTLHSKTKQKQNLRPSLPTNYTHFRASNYFTELRKTRLTCDKGKHGLSRMNSVFPGALLITGLWLTGNGCDLFIILSRKQSLDWLQCSVGGKTTHNNKIYIKKQNKQKTEQKKGRKRGRWACGAQQHPILYAPNQASLLPNGINVKLFTVL